MQIVNKSVTSWLSFFLETLEINYYKQIKSWPFHRNKLKTFYNALLIFYQKCKYHCGNNSHSQRVIITTFTQKELERVDLKILSTLNKILKTMAS